MPTSGPIRSEIGPTLFHLNNHVEICHQLLDGAFNDEVIVQLRAEGTQLERSCTRIEELNR
jgi:hypothetical protein